MKTQFFLLLFVLATATVSKAQQLTLGDISGQWTGPIQFAFIVILTDQGPGLICRDQLTPACRNELPPGQEIFTITNTSIEFDFRQFVGSTTQQIAAERYPVCAESGIYPLETITPIPASEVVHYDSLTGSVTFTDPRRPNDINCIFLSVLQSAGAPRIRIQYLLRSEGPLDVALQQGPSFVCLNANGFCQIERTADGFSSDVFVEFEVTCTQGACLTL